MTSKGIQRAEIYGRTQDETEMLRLALRGDHAALRDHFNSRPGIMVNRRDTADNHHNTALHYAVLTYNLDMITFLIDAGADVNAINSEGERPIDMLFMGNDRDLTEETLQSINDLLINRGSVVPRQSHHFFVRVAGVRMYTNVFGPR